MSDSKDSNPNPIKPTVEPAVAENEARKQELLVKIKEVVDRRANRKSKKIMRDRQSNFGWTAQGRFVLGAGLFAVLALYVTFGF